MPPQSGPRKNPSSKLPTNPFVLEDQYDETVVKIPPKFLNSLGFIDYDKYGNVPWTNDDLAEIFLSEEYKSITNFLGIDCEMVGVGHLKVSALGRVSIVNEFGYCVYDTFVNPMVEITDYRTKFSGIRAEDLQKAPTVDSVLRAVAQLVKGKTLVGHSIHNDLDVLKLSGHAAIRDTALYFKKLSKGNGTPSLKKLSQQYLKTSIQSGEHSSIQDAQATIKLYLLYREKWEHSFSQWRTKANINAKKLPLTEIYDMHIEPRESDLFVDSKSVFVRPNKVSGAYSSCDEYLDVQFRLLMEDFLRPLRQAVRTVNHGRKDPKTKVIQSARITGPGSFEARGNRSLIVKGNEYFEVKGRGTIFVPIEKNNLKDWEESDMFIPGSLLLLSNNNFRSVKFAIITWVNTREKDEDKSSYFYLAVNVQFCMDGPSWIVTQSDQFSIIESPAFYPAYKYTLEYFQVMQLNEFPMAKYIVDTVTTPCAPSHLRSTNETIDFSVLMKDGSSKKANPLKLQEWPKVTQLDLDKSQYEALQNALTQELTIIQGPPGTGKTYTSLQIVKMLLTNEWLCQGSPVLIVSYTNHSLDQVLELIFEFATKGMFPGNEKQAEKTILRIGGGSKSKSVEPLTLIYKEDKVREKMYLKKRITTFETALKKLDGFDFNNYLLDKGILNFKNLPSCMLTKLKSDETCKSILENKIMMENPCKWFGLEKRSLKGYKTVDKLFVFRCNNLESILAKDFPQIINYCGKAKDVVPEELEDLIATRWMCYLFVVEKLKIIVEELNDSLDLLKTQFREVEHFESVKNVLKSAKIVGMTTTGAAKYKTLVKKHFQSKIMIVEEAAHVIEAHVIAALTEHCQQMILIGDHKQLRPLPADNDLAENYKLNISLMERLVQNGVTQNNRNWIQLLEQHRMRPEIARMVCPVIYKHLKNHPIVFKHPSVRGCDKNLFFVNHQNPDEQDKASFSYYNKYEARWIVEILTYFINYRRYYKPTKITVIVAYLAQKNMVDNMLKYRPQLSDVRVSTIDGYQGEENDIILLSLVRSNDEKRVGFLKTDNRVCVALSRARHGLFMIGNMACLESSSNTWNQINQILIETNSIGSKLPLSPHQPKLKQLINIAKNSQSWPKVVYNSSVKNEIVEKELLPKILTVSKPKPLLKAFLMSKAAPESKPAPISKPALMSKPAQISKPAPMSKLAPMSTTRAVSKDATVPKGLAMPVDLSTTPKDLLVQLVCGHTHTFSPNQLNNIGKLSDLPNCVVMVTKKLSCGHSKRMQCHQFKKYQCVANKNTKFPCGHKQKVPCNKISTFKCIVDMMKNLPCGHQQKSHCHQSPSSIKCNACTVIRRRGTGTCDPLLVQSMSKLKIASS